MTGRQLKRFCQVGEEGQRLLEAAMERLGFSARAYDRILKVSRTIADLEQSGPIRLEHLAEAIQYGSLDRTPGGEKGGGRKQGGVVPLRTLLIVGSKVASFLRAAFGVSPIRWGAAGLATADAFVAFWACLWNFLPGWLV